MSVSLKEVNNHRDLIKFIKFPMKLYKDNKYYVPPLISEEINTLDKSKNGIFKNSMATAHYFLAYKNGEIVGRIATIVNWKEVREQKKTKARFGWFDFIDDKEVSKALIDKAKEFGKSLGLESLEGPVGFSNLDKAGLLTKGFDEIPTMVTLYNSEYYKQHLIDLGFEEASTWLEYKLTLSEELPSRVVKFNKLIKKRYNLSLLRFKNKHELKEIVEPMFELLDKTYGHLSSYVPFEPEQIQYYKEKYINFINPEFVTSVIDSNNKLIAFAVTMPSYSKALQKAKGKLFPLGWYHFYKASKKNDTAAFYLIGIDPEYQGKGITAIVFTEMFRTFKKYGISNLETNPELEENKNIQALWKDYNPINHKVRKTYSINL